MSKYTIQLNYVASINVEVLANDEGEALNKAREIAEDADMNEFIITEEKESSVVAVDG